MNLKRKTVFFVVISAVLLSLSFSAYKVSLYKLTDIRRANNHLNREILNEKNNELQLKRYLNYKKEIGNIKNLKAEPVDILATFSSVKDLTRLDKVIDDTYRRGGLFFLSEFLLKNDDSDKKAIKIRLSGKKITFFRLNR